MKKIILITVVLFLLSCANLKEFFPQKASNINTAEKQTTLSTVIKSGNMGVTSVADTKYITIPTSVARDASAIIYPEAGFSVALKKLDTLVVFWDCSWKDIKGNDEQVTHFRLYRSLNDGDWNVVDITPKDTINFRPRTWIQDVNIVSLPDSIVKIVYAVTAIDKANNESEPNVSTDSTAAHGGWYIYRAGQDFEPPPTDYPPSRPLNVDYSGK